MSDSRDADIAAISAACRAALSAIGSLGGSEEWCGEEWPAEIGELVIGAYNDLRRAHNLATAYAKEQP